MSNIKQKIVIKFANDKKTRSKAMKTAVRISGVESVSLKEGQIEVVGVGVDAAELTNSLREKFGESTSCFFMKKEGFAEIVSVNPVKNEENKDNKDINNKNYCQCSYGYHTCNTNIPMYMAYSTPNDPSCSIM